MSYEEEQRKIQRLLEEFLSDDDDDEDWLQEDSADDYKPGDSDDESSYESSTSEEFPKIKGQKKEIVKPKVTSLDDGNENAEDIQLDVTINAIEDQGEVHNEVIHEDEHESDTIQQTIEAVISEYILSDENDNGDAAPNDNDNVINWFEPDGSFIKQFSFMEPTPGIKQYIIDSYYDKKPYNFFKLLLTDEIIAEICKETNRYAEQSNAKTIYTKSRLRW